MKGALLVSAAVSSLVSIIATIVALNVLAPAVVEAQETVDEGGTDRVRLSRGPGASAAATVLSQDGIPRVSMNTGGSPFEGSTRPDSAGVAVFAPEGPAGFGGPGPIARLGTTLDGAGSSMYLRDRQGQIRIFLWVDGDGNPSMEMRDASGNVTWRAQ